MFLSALLPAQRFRGTLCARSHDDRNSVVELAISYVMRLDVETLRADMEEVEYAFEARSSPRGPRIHVGTEMYQTLPKTARVEEQ